MEWCYSGISCIYWIAWIAAPPSQTVYHYNHTFQTLLAEDRVMGLGDTVSGNWEHHSGKLSGFVPVEKREWSNHRKKLRQGSNPETGLEEEEYVNWRGMACLKKFKFRIIPTSSSQCVSNSITC